MNQIPPELQAQINALRAEYEQIILNISHQCADRAIVIAAQAMRIKELEAATVQGPAAS